MTGCAGRLAVAALAVACVTHEERTEKRARLLSDSDGDGIMTEEGCGGPDCFSLPNPDPSCVYLEVREDAAGVCIACLDGAFVELYSDCGSLPPPLPAPDEAPPGSATDLWCEPSSAPDGTLCWRCLAPDATVVTDGCAVPSAPPAPGVFCTASLEGDLLCVWCCDPDGAVLLESCGEPSAPIDATCEVYYDDGNVVCTRCLAAGGWVASDECVLDEDPERPVE